MQNKIRKILYFYNFKIPITTLSTLLIAFSSISATFGYIIGYKTYFNQIKKYNGNDIVEKTVYLPQDYSFYIDKNAPGEIFQTLLSDSQNHFTFTFNVSNQHQFEDYRDFVLANLENQYSILSAKFNIEIPIKIEIILIDDRNTYEKSLNRSYEQDTLTFAAFARGNQKIMIYQNPNMSFSKYQITKLISHELVHCFQYTLNNNPTPSWFLEGIAQAYSYPKEEPILLADAKSKIPNLETLDKKLSSKYREDYSIGYNSAELFTKYLIDKYGEEKITNLFLFDFFTKFENHFEETLGISPEEAYAEWLNTF